MKKLIAVILMMYAGLILLSCNEQPTIKQDYDFSVSTWHLQGSIEEGEEVEIRFYLKREGAWDNAEYSLSYIQLEGAGIVTDADSHKVIPREQHPLSSISDYDDSKPLEHVFTLYYKSISSHKTQLKFFVKDNFDRVRELEVNFNPTQS